MPCRIKKVSVKSISDNTFANLYFQNRTSTAHTHLWHDIVFSCTQYIGMAGSNLDILQCFLAAIQCKAHSVATLGTHPDQVTHCLHHR